MSAPRSPALQNDFRRSVDMGYHSDEDIRVIRKLRKKRSVELKESRSILTEGRPGQTSGMLPSSTGRSEPILENINMRPRWHPDSFLLPRLRYAKKISRLASYRLASPPLGMPPNEAFEIISTDEDCKDASQEESHSELREFIHHRRHTSANHRATCINVEPGPSEEAMPSGTSTRIEPNTNQLYGKSSLPVTHTADRTSSGPIIQRIPSTCSDRCVLAARQSGLNDEIDIRPTSATDLSCEHSRSKLPPVFEEARTWRRATETALATSPWLRDGLRENCCQMESCQTSCEVKSLAMTSNSTRTIDDKLSTKSDEYGARVLRQQSDTLVHSASMQSFNEMEMSPTKLSLSPLSNKIPSNQVLSEDFQRMTVSVDPSFTLSHIMDGCLRSLSEYPPLGTYSTYYQRPRRAMSFLQDLDKEAIFPAHQPSAPPTDLDVSVQTKFALHSSTSLASSERVYNNATSEPTGLMTRGRVSLEQRALSRS